MSHQSGKGFYQHPIKLLIVEVHHDKIGDRFSKELWWLIFVEGLVKSGKMFKLFYDEEGGTGVLSELFKLRCVIVFCC